MLRILAIVVCAAALTACGEGGSAPAGEAEVAQVRVSDVPCEGPSWFVDEPAGHVSVFGETLYEAQSDDDASVGIEISGVEGSSCTGSAMEGQVLTCVMHGPIIGLAIQDTVQYRIPESRTATLTQDGAVTTCFLNEEG